MGIRRHQLFFLGLDHDGRIQSLQFAVGVGLNRIKGNILVLLGMPLVFFAVKEGAVGFEDVMNAIAKGGDKTGAIAFKRHIAFDQAVIDFGKVFEGHAVGFKLLPGS